VRFLWILWFLALSCIPQDENGDLEWDVPEGAHWADIDFPVTVRFEASLSDCHEASLREAIDRINDELGQRAFLLAPLEVPVVEDSDLVLRLGDIHVQERELLITDGNVLGRAIVLVLPTSRRLVGALVRLAPLECDEYATLVKAHELGHALGLRHQHDCKDCVMHPTLHTGERWHPDSIDYVQAQVRGEPIGVPMYEAEDETVMQVEVE